MKYLFLLFSLYSTLLIKADIVEIPRQDLKNIKCFFEDLIDQHDYAYTIFGSKPMSLADFCLESPRNLSFYKWLRSKIFMIRRKAILKSWYKYREEFDFKDFIFLDEEHDWINCLVMILINKKNMLHVLEEHSSIFKEELGEDFNPELFLERLEKKEVSITKAINKSQKLMGIMLGYGVRNATLFQERFNIRKSMWKREKDNLPEDEALTKKLANVEGQCNDFSELEEDAIMHPLYFLADTSHPETVRLKKQYEDDRQKIEELMRQPKFMNKVLERLIR
jgi:uncharacterized protein YihD (DUF1040 family)